MSDVNPQLSAQLREVLTKFTVPDGSTLLQANKDLQRLSQDSAFLSSLFHVLSYDESSQVRQTAAIVFRRKLASLWKSIERNNQLGIRDAAMKRLVQEVEPVVQRAVMEVIGAIAKKEFSMDKPWPDLISLMKNAMHSENIKEKECGAELMKVVCETSAMHLEKHYSSILTLINEALQHNYSIAFSCHCMEAFNALIIFLGDDHAKHVRPLVLKCINVVKMLLESSCESQAADMIEIFETLIEIEVSFIAPFVKDLIVFILQVVSNHDLDDEIRSRVLSLLQCIIRTKKKAIFRSNLIGLIIDALCPILVSPVDESVENDEIGYIGEALDTQITPLAATLRVMDDMALHFPPEKLFDKLMPFIQACATNEEVRFKRGLLLTLGCLSEGTSEYIKANHLQPFLETVCRGALDSNTRVRNAALFALGQFSNHLQPDINKFTSEIMPILFDVIMKVGDSKKDTGITKAYYALENLVENLGSDILPYLEKLMCHLLNTLQSTSDVHIKELIISAIGAVSNGAKENLLPFLPEILRNIQKCLATMSQQPSSETEELSVLHSHSLDTLGVLVRNLGQSNIQLAEDSMKLGMQLVSAEATDPDLRRSAYGLFASVSTIVRESMEPFLPVIIKYMLNTLKSDEGVAINFSSRAPEYIKSNFLDDATEEDLENGDDEIESDAIDGFTVENSYMEEKCDALDALSDFAKYSPRSFQPYLRECYLEAYSLHDFPHNDVRKSAISACGQFIITSHKLQDRLPYDLVSTLSEVVRKDSERLVVMQAIMSCKEMIESCGVKAIGLDNKKLVLDNLMKALLTVLRQKSACQDNDVDDEDDEQAEYDELLMECCGELYPILAGDLREEFIPYFMQSIKFFVNKLKSSCAMSEQSFAAGTIAETVQKLGPYCPAELLNTIVPRFIQLSRSSWIEVRNNAIFGLGVLMQNGGAGSVNHYPLVLGCLSQALSEESCRRVLDNILSAVARMIVSHIEIMPMQQVLPVLLNHLPVEVDHEEDSVVYGCLATLLRNPEIRSDFQTVVKIIVVFAKVITNDQVPKDVRVSIEDEIRSLKSLDENLFEQIMQKDVLNEVVCSVVNHVLAR